MFSPSFLIQLLLNSLLLGGLYALLGVGLSLCFGVMRFFNLIHGSFVLLSCYSTYTLYRLFNLDPILSAPICFAIFFCIGFLLRHYLIAYFKTLEAMIISGFSLLIIIENIILLIWGSHPKTITTWYSTLRFELIPDVYFLFINFLCFIFGLSCLFFLHLFLKKTYLGKAIRALSQNEQIAQVYGVNVKLTRDLTYALSMGFAAVGGVLAAMASGFDPVTDMLFLTKSVSVVILGGLGSILGTIIGGICLGVVECFAGFFGARYQAFVGIIVFLVIITIKPKGFFGLYFE